MKVRFWVVSARGTSLRDSLNNDLTKDRTRKTNRYPVRLQQQQKIDRPEGWSWVHSRSGGKGAVRYRWNSQLQILECWAVTKGGNRPSQLIGEFVESVLNSQRRGVKSIHIEVG
jgi:hypothetical protein